VFRYLPAHGKDADGVPEAESPEEIRAEMSANGTEPVAEPALVPEA